MEPVKPIFIDVRISEEFVANGPKMKSRKNERRDWHRRWHDQNRKRLRKARRRETCLV